MMKNKFPLVKFDFDDMPKKYHHLYKKFKNKVFVLLCEIEQMPGHCVICEMKTGKIYCAYHTENFIKLTDDET